MPNADASDHSRFPGRFVQNVLQHRDVLALGRSCDHQSLGRLAEREGRTVLSGEIHRHHPVDVVTERSLSDSDGVRGFLAIVRAAFPQWSDVFIGQIHLVADIHCPNKLSNSSGATGNSAALQKTVLTSKEQTKRESNRCQRSKQSPNSERLTH